MTYYVIHAIDSHTGFRYADLGLAVPPIKHRDFRGNNLELLEAFGYEDHKKAVHKMLRLRKECAQHNYDVDPNYRPRKDHI